MRALFPLCVCATRITLLTDTMGVTEDRSVPRHFEKPKQAGKQNQRQHCERDIRKPQQESCYLRSWPPRCQSQLIACRDERQVINRETDSVLAFWNAYSSLIRPPAHGIPQSRPALSRRIRLPRPCSPLSPGAKPFTPACLRSRFPAITMGTAPDARAAGGASCAVVKETAKAVLRIRLISCRSIEQEPAAAKTNHDFS